MFRKDRGSDRPARPGTGQRGADAQPKLDAGSSRSGAGPKLARTGTPKRGGTEAKAAPVGSAPARAPWPKPTPPGVTPNRLTALLGEPVTRPVNPPSEPVANEPRRDSGKRMHIGQDISISGEITTCDVLVIDGHVDAKVRECGRLEIGPAGTLHGDIEVKNAEIGGHFDGKLNVTDRLTVRGTGRVSGTVRYGRLEVTVGGQLRGDIAPAEDLDEAAEHPSPPALSEVSPAGLDRPSAASILRPSPRPEPRVSEPVASDRPEPTALEERPEPKAPANSTAEARAASTASPTAPAGGTGNDSAEPSEESHPQAPEHGAVTRLLGQSAAE